MIPFTSDEAFNALEWNDLDGHELNDLIEGAAVIGCEPIDYPLTSGMIFYLKCTNGMILTVDIGSEDYDDTANLIYLKIAKAAGS